MSNSVGYIYILTNPSFPQYVKIGYATDVKQRLDELNRSTAVPFAFRVYATYEVDSALSDKKLHSILDKLNPNLRSVEDVDGKKRVREFYDMDAEDAYSILEAIADINGYSNRLKKWKATVSEQKDEELAKEINEQHQERLSPFAFSMCGIEVGEQVEFSCVGNPNNGEVCTVVDDKHVEYKGEVWSLSALARVLANRNNQTEGTRYFKYKGEILKDIRRRMMGDSIEPYNYYQSKRQRTEKMLQEICVNNRRITIDTSRIKSTPVLIDDKRVMSIYYRSDAVRIDVVIASEIYAIATQLEAEGIAYQKPSANPFASSGTYAIFINEENEEKAYKRFFGID